MQHHQRAEHVSEASSLKPETHTTKAITPEPRDVLLNTAVFNTNNLDWSNTARRLVAGEYKKFTFPSLDTETVFHLLCQDSYDLNGCSKIIVAVTTNPLSGASELSGTVRLVLGRAGIEENGLPALDAMQLMQVFPDWPHRLEGIPDSKIGADVYRRIVLGQYHESGRYFIDLEELIADKKLTLETTIPPIQTLIATQIEALSSEKMLDLMNMFALSETVGGITLERQRIIELVEAAILGPSGGNCQPWKWVYYHGILFLFHDISRSASWLNYGHCGSFVALGAACENLVLQAHAMHLEVQLRSFPLEHETRLVAAIQFFSEEASRQTESHLYDGLVSAISSRNTNRRSGAREPLSRDILSKIQSAAQSIPGATFFSLEKPNELQEIGLILGAADRLRFLYQPYHDDMMREIRWSKTEADRSFDGIDLASLELSPSDSAALQMCKEWPVLSLVQQWKGGRALEKIAKRSIESASSVALVTMLDSHPSDYFNGGRSIQRAWLMATQQHVAFQPVSALIYMFARSTSENEATLPEELTSELKALWGRYRKLFDVNDHMGEVLLFRLSTAEASSVKSLRRPVNDVLSFFA